MVAVSRLLDYRARLPQPWRNLLLTLHVVAAVSVLGADLVLLALGLSGLGGRTRGRSTRPPPWWARGWWRRWPSWRSAPACCWAP
jgi:hypothetical protein